jgi:hypothetical protein
MEVEYDEHLSITATPDPEIETITRTLDTWYNMIKDEFPTNAGAHLGIDGRNLRTGNKAKVKKRIQTLIDESYNMDAVLKAIKYEVWFRKKSSSTNDNKLDFMQGLEAWLNNTTNIDAMIERSRSSAEFKVSGNEQVVKRKVKLS